MESATSGRRLRIQLPDDVQALLSAAPNVTVPESRQELLELATGRGDVDEFEVAYEVPREGRVVEAQVVRCRNGVSVNYPDPYMRRRDPECMVIADEDPSEKTRYSERFDTSFLPLRSEILDWLSQQELIVVPFN